MVIFGIQGFKGNKVFEEEIWEYTNKNSILQRYNNESYWNDYTLSGNTIISDDFSSDINFGGDTFSFTDGDGKSQSFTRWNGTIESFLNKALYDIDPEDETSNMSF